MSDLQKENKRLRRVNKRTKAALVTTIEEGNEDDSSLSEDGSQSFNAAIAGVQEGYPELHDGIVLAHKIPHLRLREEILIDSQTTHDVFCNPKYVKKSAESEEESSPEHERWWNGDQPGGRCTGLVSGRIR